jgi:hypothetical protein
MLVDNVTRVVKFKICIVKRNSQARKIYYNVENRLNVVLCFFFFSKWHNSPGMKNRKKHDGEKRREGDRDREKGAACPPSPTQSSPKTQAKPPPPPPPRLTWRIWCISSYTAAAEVLISLLCLVAGRDPSARVVDGDLTAVCLAGALVPLQIGVLYEPRVAVAVILGGEEDAGRHRERFLGRRAAVRPRAVRRRGVRCGLGDGAWMWGRRTGGWRGAVLLAGAGEAAAAGAEDQGGEERAGRVLHQQVRAAPIYFPRSVPQPILCRFQYYVCALRHGRTPRVQNYMHLQRIISII